jgi:hypothetical protein
MSAIGDGCPRTGASRRLIDRLRLSTPGMPSRIRPQDRYAAGLNGRGEGFAFSRLPNRRGGILRL